MTHQVAQPVSNLQQCHVTGFMTEGVVHLFETVQIKQ